MKIITAYVAYDNTRFDTMEECREYEQYAWDMGITICETVKFCDSLGVEIYPLYFHTVEEIIKWLDVAYDSDCDYLKIIEDVPSSAWGWYTDYFGYNIPQEKGMYRYNWDASEWERIAE